MDGFVGVDDGADGFVGAAGEGAAAGAAAVLVTGVAADGLARELGAGVVLAPLPARAEMAERCWMGRKVSEIHLRCIQI